MENLSKPSVVNNCDICGGIGWVYHVRNGQTIFSEVVPCKCKEEEINKAKRDILLRTCELPTFTETMTFELFKIYPAVKTAYESAKQMAENTGELCWLTLIGHNGTGKTHLAIAVCKAWMKSGIPTKYAFVSLLLDELRQGFSQDKNNSYESRFHRYCNIPLLLLDDYGVESSTPWVQEKLDTIIDYRLMNNLSLIVTSNKSLDEMPSRIGSRLARHPKSKIINIKAEDYVPNFKSEKMSR